MGAYAQALEGHVLGGRYEVERLCRVGGQGIVFRARNRRSGEACAVKLARHAYHRPAEFGLAEILLARDRIRAEAEALWAVASGPFPVLREVIEERNPLHVPERGVAVTETEPFLVMEWIPGTPLSRLAAAPPLSEACGIALAVLDELRRVYALPGRWVYTDLRPEHIVVAEPVTGAGSCAGTTAAPVRLLDAGGLIPLAGGPAAFVPVDRGYLPAAVAHALDRGEDIEPDPRWAAYALGASFEELARATQEGGAETGLTQLASDLLDPAVQDLAEARSRVASLCR